MESIARCTRIRIRGEERYRRFVKYVIMGVKVRYSSVVVVVEKEIGIVKAELLPIPQPN